MIEVQFDGETICTTQGETLPEAIVCKAKVDNQDAYKMSEPFRLQDKDGVWTEGTPNSYIVIGTDDNPFIVSKSDFNKDYEVV